MIRNNLTSSPTEAEGLDERSLLAGFLRGEEFAIRKVDAWVAVVLHECHLDRTDQREDLEQEIRLRIFRSLAGGNFHGRSTLRTYLHRLAKNVCIDFLRRTNRQRTQSDKEKWRGAPPSGSRPGIADTVMARDLLSKILEGTPDEDRRILELVYVERLSYAEVARSLELPEGTVKSRMSRCRTRLLQRYRALGREQER